jgi:ABC-type uncharacterized transport system permease subunit
MANVLFLITASLYALATLCYLAQLMGRGEGVVRLARLALGAAVVAHLGLIGWYCVQHLNPLRDLRGALSLTAWLVATGFLLTTRRQRMGILGGFVTPLALALLVATRLTPSHLTAAGGTEVVLGRLHILLSALGVAVFALAAAVAVIYLAQVSALKNKRLGPLFRRTPPLRSLDLMGRRLIVVGFPLYTLALITGAAWVTQLPGPPVGARPEYLIAGATWLVFAALIVLRVTVGMRGRRAALLTVGGFLAMVLVLLIYLLRRLGS